ncbi:MAG: phosphoenolpyruvate--protein phosphotransferase [Synergistaceae bacterium]|nr:phosphoenolpyruvate--protein phosphotransferase [Synergistaceae bacterium]
MISASGLKVVSGIALGRIKVYKAHAYDIKENLINEAEANSELERFESARVKVQAIQHELYEKALETSGEETAGIFEAHELMLDDEDLIDACKELIIDERHNAEYAVENAFESSAQMFREMDDEYFQARSADVIDLKVAMLDALFGYESNNVTEPSILLAEDLAPSETVKLDKSLLLGLVTRGGSSNSHTAILARSMNLPTIIQCKDINLDEWDGKFAVLDGYNATLYVEPEQDLINKFQAQHDEDLKKLEALKNLKGKASMTRDGRKIKIYANIGGPEDINAVIENDAEGVGLFRSEFVYLHSKDDPSEETQFNAYKKVLEALAPRQIIIRTCDIGADKTIDYMNLDKEENPALGFRAIRICLTRKDFFKRQLRALLRASAYGNLGIMFPMITSLWELQECKNILEECRAELERERIKIGEFETGIMIETPAAAVCADELAEEVDFFSIGTNDLTQYTCAIDRQNAKLEKFADTHHPAVLKLIQMTIDAGHRHNIWVGICGELGADLSLTETFLKMGIDELSVNAKSVLPLRGTVRSVSLNK